LATIDADASGNVVVSIDTFKRMPYRSGADLLNVNLAEHTGTGHGIFASRDHGATFSRFIPSTEQNVNPANTVFDIFGSFQAGNCQGNGLVVRDGCVHTTTVYSLKPACQSWWDDWVVPDFLNSPYELFTPPSPATVFGQVVLDNARLVQETSCDPEDFGDVQVYYAKQCLTACA